ncbi:MAG: copper resistance CopC/CopD family protein [Actinomycetota bacterium]
MRRGHPLRAASILTLGLATAVAPGIAQAHAFLVSSTPQPGERLESSPPSIRLRFTEPVVAGNARLEVKTPDGQGLDIGTVQFLERGSELEAPLPVLARGAYVVSWQVQSALDGHVELGEFAFAVGIHERLPTIRFREAGRVAWPESAASWLALTGLMLAVGALASERWIWSPVERGHGVSVPHLPARAFLALALLGSLLQFLLLLRRAPGAGADGGSWVETVATPVGVASLLQLLMAAQALPLVRLRGARHWALAPLGLGLAAAALRGHAASGRVWWAVPANILHLGAAALWAGGLLHLILVARRLRGDEARHALAEGARRYAGLALALVALVLASGAVVALSQIGTPSELVTTTYGRVLIVKLALVTSAVLFALAARRRALGRGHSFHAGLLRRLTAPEGVLVLAAIAVATVLANTTPPRSQAAPLLLGPPPLEGPVVRLAGLAGSPLAVHLAAAPGQLQIRVVDTLREPAADARMEISGRAPDGTGLGISPRTCGPGCVTIAFEWQEGTTELAVSVSSQEWGEGTARFSVPWPPGPERPGLLTTVVRAMSDQPRIRMTERVSSGLGGASEYTVKLSGDRFVAQELYAVGGVTDVRLLPSPPGLRRITAFLPGSWIWYLLEIDEEDLIRSETIVSPGHEILRTLTYPERD